jgi:NAD(P)-dependent dehydrogenase (short-subunit alcohol dehydrogenase family)
MDLEGLFDLRCKTAIVTGGGAGLGLQFAEGLAAAGANLVLVARNATRCEEAAAKLAESYAVETLGAPCDVRDPAQVQLTIDAAKSRFGTVDILVNNAGTSWGAPVVDYPLDGWMKVINVNLTGMFLFSQAAGREMIAQGGGKILNIASVTAFEGTAPEVLDAIAYNTSKGGVIAFTRDLAVKWARHGVNVNAIAPGWFPTELSEWVLENSGQTLLDQIPLARFGGPGDLKGAAIFLASRASDFITGQTLVVDGGQSIA